MKTLFFPLPSLTKRPIHIVSESSITDTSIRADSCGLPDCISHSENPVDISPLNPKGVHSTNRSIDIRKMASNRQGFSKFRASKDEVNNPTQIKQGTLPLLPLKESEDSPVPQISDSDQDSKNEVEHIETRTRQVNSTLKNKRVTKLPRGGLIVSTVIGNIQFGMPPETIKDSLNQGIDVPTIFVVSSVS